MIEIILEAERALATGQLDQAERLYRQAAQLDPRNSIAVVGLARVALDRGDERGAYTLARNALEIDPENAAGQRLAERLEEVIRFRGEEPPAVKAPPAAESAPALESAPAAKPPPAAAKPPSKPLTPPRRKRRSLLGRILRRR
jgi:thioredoxin-like negative regulator of GroEL